MTFSDATSLTAQPAAPVLPEAGLVSAALIAELQPRIQRLARRMSPAQAEDLAAEGMIALVEAARRWPVMRGGSFAAFAWPAVRGAMLSARLQIRVAVSVPERRMRDALAGRLSPELREAFAQLLQPGEEDSLAEALAGPTSEELALSRERALGQRRALARALRLLGRDERRLVVGHLLRESAPIEAIAQRLRLSPQRARAVQARALHKMRNGLIQNGFVKDDFL